MSYNTWGGDLLHSITSLDVEMPNRSRIFATVTVVDESNIYNVELCIFLIICAFLAILSINLALKQIPRHINTL
jgi:hypothetical protein